VMIAVIGFQGGCSSTCAMRVMREGVLPLAFLVGRVMISFRQAD